MTSKVVIKMSNKKINFIDRYLLCRRGSKDLQNAVLQINADGTCNSPFITKEVTNFKANDFKLWTKVQMDHQSQLEVLQRTIKNLAINNQNLKKLNMQLSNLESKVQQHNEIDTAILYRQYKQAFEEKTKLKKLVTKDFSILVDKFSKIIEDIKSCEMVTGFCKTHCLRRISCYLDGAFKTHLDYQTVNLDMTTFDLNSGAYEAYMRANKPILDEITNFIQIYKGAVEGVERND